MEELMQANNDINWCDICEITKKAALKLVGLSEPSVAKPWLQGREKEIEALDNAVSLTKQLVKKLGKTIRPWTEEMNAHAATVKKMARAATKAKRLATRTWEDHWWSDIADQAETAKQRQMNLVYMMEIGTERWPRCCAR